MTLVDQLAAGLTSLAGVVRALQQRPSPAVLPPPGWIVISPGILSNAGAAPTSGRQTWYPMPVAAGTYDALIVNVTTAQAGGSTTLKAAIYADDGTGGMPATAGGPVASVTLPAPTQTGTRVGTLAAPWVSPGGIYWVSLFYLATTAPTTPPQLSSIANATFAIPQTGGNFTSRIRGYVRTGLTDLAFDTTTTSNVTVTGGPDVGIVALRRQ